MPSWTGKRLLRRTPEAAACVVVGFILVKVVVQFFDRYELLTRMLSGYEPLAPDHPTTPAHVAIVEPQWWLTRALHGLL